MNFLSYALQKISDFITLGGPVVAILLVMSVLSLAIALYKLTQFQALGVGRRKNLEQALLKVDTGDQPGAKALLRQSRSHLRHVMEEAFSQSESAPSTERLAERLYARAETRLATLERGFRALDTIAQIAPLLGLFGTVIGMIEAFQNLQDAGTSVDPSLLAGGIWVALMTTAAGLAVAMPTSLLLSWFESRVAGERVFIDKALNMLLCPADNRDAAA